MKRRSLLAIVFISSLFSAQARTFLDEKIHVNKVNDSTYNYNVENVNVETKDIQYIINNIKNITIDAEDISNEYYLSEICKSLSVIPLDGIPDELVEQYLSQQPRFKITDKKIYSSILVKNGTFQEILFRFNKKGHFEYAYDNMYVDPPAFAPRYRNINADKKGDIYKSSYFDINVINKKGQAYKRYMLPYTSLQGDNNIAFTKNGMYIYSEPVDEFIVRSNGTRQYLESRAYRLNFFSDDFKLESVMYRSFADGESIINQNVFSELKNSYSFYYRMCDTIFSIDKKSNAVSASYCLSFKGDNTEYLKATGQFDQVVNSGLPPSLQRLYSVSPIIQPNSCAKDIWETNEFIFIGYKFVHKSNLSTHVLYNKKSSQSLHGTIYNDIFDKNKYYRYPQLNIIGQNSKYFYVIVRKTKDLKLSEKGLLKLSSKQIKTIDSLADNSYFLLAIEF